MKLENRIVIIRHSKSLKEHFRFEASILFLVQKLREGANEEVVLFHNSDRCCIAYSRS